MERIVWANTVENFLTRNISKAPRMWSFGWFDFEIASIHIAKASSASVIQKVETILSTDSELKNEFRLTLWMSARTYQEGVSKERVIMGNIEPDRPLFPFFHSNCLSNFCLQSNKNDYSWYVISHFSFLIFSYILDGRKEKVWPFCKNIGENRVEKKGSVRFNITHNGIDVNPYPLKEK